jgi:hypothetical protein
VVVPTLASSGRSCPGDCNAWHGMAYVTTLDVISTKRGGDGNIWVRARSARAEAATDDEVAVEEAEIRVNQDVSRQALTCPQWRMSSQAMRWEAGSVEKLCSRALVECLRKDGTCDPSMPVDSVSADPGLSERSGRRQPSTSIHVHRNAKNSLSSM